MTRPARAAAVLAMVVFGAGLLVVSEMRRVACIRSGVTAKQLCSCIFVDGGTETGCRSDLHPGYDSVHAAIDLDSTTVRAWIPMLGARTASDRAESGCTLE